MDTQTCIQHKHTFNVMASGPSALLDTGDTEQETIISLKEVIVNQKGEGSSQSHKINTVII